MSKYLVLVTLLALVILQVTAQQHFIKIDPIEEFRKNAKICADELGMIPDNEYDEEKTKCFLACMYRQIGVVDKEGNLNIENLEKALSVNYNENEKILIEECDRKFREYDVCVRVVDTQDCIFNIRNIKAV